MVSSDLIEVERKAEGNTGAFLSLITVCQEADKYTQLCQSGPKWEKSAVVAGEKRPFMCGETPFPLVQPHFAEEFCSLPAPEWR